LHAEVFLQRWKLIQDSKLETEKKRLYSRRGTFWEKSFFGRNKEFIALS
jgi:hypothetical protein